MLNTLENIIKGCCRKEPLAQQILYEKYSSRLFGVCLRYSGSKEDAQDTLHEGFLKIFEKIEQFEARGSFEGWIRRIMVNTALEKYRTQNRMIHLHETSEEFERCSIEEVTDTITAKELLHMITELSPQYRIVFNLYAIEGYSHKEISEMLDISEGTSKSNLSRARAILQEKVKELYKLTERVG